MLLCSHSFFFYRESRWVPLPTAPHIPHPVQLDLIERRMIAPNLLNISFTVTGGADKSSLHITPLNGYSLVQWSPTQNAIDVHGQRQTYFVFLCYGHYSGPWNFWILLRHVSLYQLVIYKMKFLVEHDCTRS